VPDPQQERARLTARAQRLVAGAVHAA
jgi:hypothetical protein